MAFSQSEKIKSGLIWISQGLEILNGLEGPERNGAEKAIQAIGSMVFQEVRLARNIAGDGAWDEIERHIDQAMVMLDSGVGAESVVLLTEALSHVTNIGHRSMSLLREQGLL